MEKNIENTEQLICMNIVQDHILFLKLPWKVTKKTPLNLNQHTRN